MDHLTRAQVHQIGASQAGSFAVLERRRHQAAVIGQHGTAQHRAGQRIRRQHRPLDHRLVHL